MHRAPSIKVAEAAKVIENTQRDLNIALMNELAIIFDRMGIRTADVLAAAGTKWNFLKFRPGLVGGHCIGVDPYYLTMKAQQLGYQPEVILAGRRINNNVGSYVAQRLVKLLIDADITVKNARVGVLGLTFKEDCNDIRNSKVPDILRELRSFGIAPMVHDPVASAPEAMREYGVKLVAHRGACGSGCGGPGRVPQVVPRARAAGHPGDDSRRRRPGRRQERPRPGAHRAGHPLLERLVRRNATHRERGRLRRPVDACYTAPLSWVRRASTARPQGFLRRHAVKLGASFLITFGIVYTVHKGGLKLVPEGGDFEHVRPWTVPAYVATLGVVAWFRSVRWRFLLRSIADVPKKRLFAVSCIGFAAILLLPFRIGEFVRPYMIRTRPGRAQGAGAAADLAHGGDEHGRRRAHHRRPLPERRPRPRARLACRRSCPFPDRVVGLPVTVAHVRMSGYAMFGLFTVAFATVAVFYFARSWAHRTTLAVVGKVSIRLAETLAGMAEKFADGLHVFGRGRDAFGFLAETTLLLDGQRPRDVAPRVGVRRRARRRLRRRRSARACALMGMLGCAILIPGPAGDARRLPGRDLRGDDDVLSLERRHRRGRGIRVSHVRVAVPLSGRHGRRRPRDGRGGGLRALEEAEGVRRSADAA